MSYPIEILTTSASELPAIEAAIKPLNKIQQEFQFTLAPARLLEKAYAFLLEAYFDQEVADWLDKYRKESGGNRPYIILILTGSLNINHFGGHVASEGFAFFTVNGHHQFVIDKVRYIKYYLARYTLSFLSPQIKGHSSSKNCMFDMKLWKQDIQLSLNSGRLCDDCTRQMQPAFNEEIRVAVKNILQHISNQFPYALVLKGGGVKGLALVGALMELEKFYSFNTFAGTSAGAIAAVLLGAGYRPSELKKILLETDMSSFIEGGLINWLLNLVSKGGAVPGEEFTQWLDGLLAEKITGKVSAIEMRDLPKRAIVYASRRNEGVIKFDSKGERCETYARIAVRYSMSIPGVFAPKKLDGENVYDGGLGNNFPLRKFYTDNQGQLFLGIYLKNSAKSKTIAGDLIDIATEGDESAVVHANLDKVVIIDPAPIKTTQFSLSDRQKQFLIDAGRLGALEFLHAYNLDAGVSVDQVDALKKAVQKERLALS